LLLAASEALPPVDGFFAAKDRAKVLQNVETTITDEKEVAIFYDKTAATFCTPLASTSVAAARLQATSHVS